ncbi:ABC transporter ATP-binding protein [Candidatus Latescibacterota bacterium]
MAKTITELDGAVISCRGRNILGPLSLTIQENEFWGIIGPNGAGKSTLLKTLTGSQRLSQGRLSLFGQAYRAASSRKPPSSVFKKVGMLLQQHSTNHGIPFTVEDVVLFGRAGFPGTGRRYGKEDIAAVGQALTRLGMTRYRLRLYRELSGGEQRKVHLARLLAQKPDLLLLDEPTAGLDIDWQERLTGLVEELHRFLGKTIVMVTHDIDRLPSCCTNVLFLRKGLPAVMGKPEKVFTSSLLSELYCCPVEVTVRRGRYHVISLGPEEMK